MNDLVQQQNVVQQQNATTDLASAEDHLGMGSKVTGLTKFICTCQTPLTIAIQGDWGVGKTSVMIQLKKKIEEDTNKKTPCIWFKTWEFSALKEDDDIFLAFILRFYCEITAKVGELSQKSDSKKDSFSKIRDSLSDGLKLFASAGESAFDAVAAIINTPALSFVAHGVGGVASWVADRIKGIKTNDLSFNDNDSRINIPNILVGVCKKMNEAIDELLKYIGEENNRLCIFIDDLDRLSPRMALELLEGIKNFVEYKKCVFILAIDKAVINQGLQSKYSVEFLKELTGGRSREDQFFDKIIQVPYNIYQKDHDLNEYVAYILGEPKDTDNILEKPNSGNYVELLKTFEAYNPRSIKRYFNLAKLCLCMMCSDEKTNKWLEYAVFAVVLLQIEDKELHDEMHSIISGGKAENLITELQTVLDESTEKEEPYSEQDSKRIEAMLNIFTDVEANTKGDMKMKHDYEWLGDIFRNTFTPTVENEEPSYISYINLIKRIVDEIKSIHQEYDFSFYNEQIGNVSSEELAFRVERAVKENAAKETAAKEKLAKKLETCSIFMNSRGQLDIGWGSAKRPFLRFASNLNKEDYDAADGFCYYKFQEKDKNLLIWDKVKKDNLTIFISTSENAYRSVIRMLREEHII